MRVIDWDDRITIYEQSPCKRTIFFHGDLDYFLPLPYMVYVLIRYLKEGEEYGRILKVACSAEPLPDDRNQLLNAEICYPPLPTILCGESQMAVCCTADIGSFWSVPFYDPSFWHSCDILLRDSDLKSFKNWAKMSFEEVLNAFRKWPKVAEFEAREGIGLPGPGGGQTECVVKMKDFLRPVGNIETLKYLFAKNIL